MDDSLAGLYLAIGIFLAVLAVLWFLLPFAVFGTKDKLTQLINETKKTNEELALLRQQLAETVKPKPSTASDSPFISTDY